MPSVRSRSFAIGVGRPPKRSRRHDGLQSSHLGQRHQRHSVTGGFALILGLFARLLYLPLAF